MTGTGRLAVDIGGTFTDVVLDLGGARTTIKVLTTPKAPEEGVIAGVADVLAKAGASAGDVGLLLHGTTLATNAILERKGAKTALLTTEGFRDVLEIGYESRFDQYDLAIEKPAPLVPRRLRLPAPERIGVDGSVLRPLDEDAVHALIPALRREGVEAVAVAYLHSYMNPAHEVRTAEIIRDALPGVAVTLSSEVCPEVREYERFTTASANAYVQPLMARYLARLKERLADAGLRCPALLMTSGGGLTTLETAARFPIRLVESGPAGGAILAARVAREMGLEKVVSFDMGGTTAKICLIERYEPESAREFEVDRSARFQKGSGLPLRIPVIEMVEIGAGGGSIARLDGMGRITVGPDSAGSDPGPAAYGRGGDQPTITDADIVLGKVDPAFFAGGEVALDLPAAETAVSRVVAGPLSLKDAETGAFGITEMVDEAMSNAVRVHAVEQGKAASEHAMVAFGGAAPLHAARLCEKLGVSTLVIPKNAGVGSAIGFLAAPIAYEVVRSRRMRLKDFNPGDVNGLILEMREEAEAVVAPAAGGAPLRETRYAFMRYLGQGHEISVPLPPQALTDADIGALQAAYDAQYARFYRRIIPGAEVEALTWGLTLTTPSEEVAALPGAASTAAPEPAGTRAVFDADVGGKIDIPVYARADLTPGASVKGPCLIVEAETSTVVSGDFQARVASNGYLILKRQVRRFRAVHIVQGKMGRRKRM